jgi:hypothetical protein
MPEQPYQKNKIYNDEVTKLLGELANLKAVNKGIEKENKIYFFKPEGPKGTLRQNPLQRELIDAWGIPEYKIFVYSGSNRIGKTTTLAIISFSTMFGFWPWSNKRLRFYHDEPRRVRIIGQDWESQIKKILIPTLKEWWPADRKLKIKKHSGTGAESFWTDVKTGSTLEILSNFQDPMTHAGANLDLVGYDEPPNKAIRNENVTRLIDRRGRELFSATLLGEPWVHTDIVQARDKRGMPARNVFAVDGDMWINEGYGLTKEGIDEYIEKIKMTDKDGSIMKARVHGKPAYLSGLICQNFKRPRHIKDRFDVPLDWIIDVGIDIHPRKEQAILFIATDPKQQKWLVNEIWRHGDGTEVGEWIVRMVTRNNFRVGRVIIDPLAKGDQNNPNTTYDKVEAVLYRNEMCLETATKDKESGIIQINGHLMGPNGEASLFVFRDMVRTIYEFESWMYDKETQKAQKKDDDMMENLYRLLLLDTVYYPPDEDDEDDYAPPHSQASSVTGY